MFGKKVKFRNIFLIALDIQIGKSRASSAIRTPPNQLVLPFYPPVENYKSRKGAKNYSRFPNWPLNLGLKVTSGCLQINIIYPKVEKYKSRKGGKTDSRFPNWPLNLWLQVTFIGVQIHFFINCPKVEK